MENCPQDLQVKEEAPKRRSRERKKSMEAQKEFDISGRSYHNILHELIESKRSTLQASGGFSKIKPNSLLCSECSKNMLSYVAILQDMLDVVVGDIAQKTTSENASCSHCDEKEVRGHRSQLSQPKSTGGSKRRKSLPSRLSTPIPTFQYQESNKNSPPKTTETPYQPSFGGLASHSLVPESIRETFVAPHSNASKINVQDPFVSAGGQMPSNSNVSRINVRDTFIATGGQPSSNENAETEKPSLLDSVVPVQFENANAKNLGKGNRDGVSEIEVQRKLENLQLSNSETIGKSPAELKQSQPGEKQFEDATISYKVCEDGFKNNEENKQLNDGFGVSTGEAVHEQWNTVESFQEQHQNETGVELEEAYVTLATNNLNALASLVLGYSLLAAKTSRTLVVLVGDGVCSELRYSLSTVFNVVQTIESLGTKEITKLSLMEDPELGISFVKLHIWQLEAFSKCVFLDSSTLVVRNSDELFKREELSAVPDIGWPDCFNSGVFVYVPSLETFWDLIDFVESQESYDGGDQGLLNMYFKNWATDISRKLPFIYNMMANVSYTYKPALKQFGQSVKIVHFFGSYKPWNVPFHSVTGDLLPTADVHPIYAQFVKFWIDVFVGCVMPLFDEDILNYCHKQKYVTVQELLQFFPASPMLETLPIQPSFRIYPESMLEERSRSATPDLPESEILPAAAEAVDNEVIESQEDEFTMPGAELGDFRGMEAWEQGKADYLGQHKSDKIMARLDFLMQGNSKN